MSEVPVSDVTDLIFYLLTYGIDVYEEDLEAVYDFCGYSDLFRVLVHMDVKKSEKCPTLLIPGIIYDASLDIESFMEDANPSSYTLANLLELLTYFAHPKVQDFCYRFSLRKVNHRIRRMPRVPLLIELARDCCRKFLVEKFHLTTTQQFYSLLNGLPISTTHRKILSFEVFDFLLSLHDYPLNAVNDANETALLISLTAYTDKNEYINDYFASRLIKAGASISSLNTEGNMLLHCALERNFLKVAELLVENGAGLNKQNDYGCTPLHMLFQNNPNSIKEGVPMLLYYGADPSICNVYGSTPFDRAMMWTDSISPIQEHLFYYTFDEYTDYKIHINVLFRIMQTKSPLFHQIIDNVTDVKVTGNLSSYCSMLFSVETQYLQRLIEKFDYVIKTLLFNCSRTLLFYHCNMISIENFSLLFESHLNPDMVEFIGNIRVSHLIRQFRKSEVSKTILTDLIFYLLTFGVDVYEEDLETIYKFYGYCDLFKVLLHVDVKKSEKYAKLLMPRIIYDVSVDVESFIENPNDYSLTSLIQLLSYFAYPKLQDFCNGCNSKELTEKVRRLPRVPLLVELARNCCRKFLVEKFHITTSKQFYSLIHWLPISSTYKKIISFEIKFHNQ
ncbi:uncharacterized protein BDFB_008577 [Asbolus verrucosus]|uniref:Uncharacterized protein n=1 Tax=Asbolus verrucosus TaxID=1661398 RepID=A0A482V1K2_ASBVE|nr:uncharacterized protein BDFB_008577 [Asbolus verrucosus]